MHPVGHLLFVSTATNTNESRGLASRFFPRRTRYTGDSTVRYRRPWKCLLDDDERRTQVHVNMNMSNLHSEGSSACVCLCVVQP